jgi:hypothetical protein
MPSVEVKRRVVICPRTFCRKLEIRRFVCRKEIQIVRFFRLVFLSHILAHSASGISICTFVPVKQVN